MGKRKDQELGCGKRERLNWGIGAENFITELGSQKHQKGTTTVAAINNLNNDSSKMCGTLVVTRLSAKLMTEKISTAIFVCLIIAASILMGFTQQDDGAVRIGGDILPSLKLTVVGNQFNGVDAADGWQATVAAQDKTSADIRLKRNGATSASHIRIPLEIRTNAAYRLNLSTVNSDACVSGVKVYMDSAHASGVRVAADAVANSRSIDISDLAQAVAATSIFSGTRVSMGGNFRTPSNALLVNLNLVLPEGQSRCTEEPVIRVSIEPAR